MTSRPDRARWPSLALMILVAAGASTAEGGNERRPITELDLFRFAWPADPQVIGDGTQAAFVRVGVDKDKDDYETSIWVVATSGGEPRRLTLGPRDTWPRWAPDGRRLLFLRRAEAEGKARPAQVFIMSLQGGEPRPLTDLPEGASAPAWAPDGKSIAFLSGTTPDDLQKVANKGKGIAPPRESDVRIVTRTEFRGDNAGYRDPKHPAQVWTVAVPPADSDDRPAAPKRLTAGPFDTAEPTWAPDGKRIYFTSTRDADPAHRVDRSALYAVGAEGGAIETIATIPGSISAPSPRPDGKMIAFRGALNDPPQSYMPTDLFVLDLTAPKTAPKNLTADFDFDIGGGLTGDQQPPRGSAPTRPAWMGQNGGRVVDKVAREGKCNLEAFDVSTGKRSFLTNAPQEVSAFHSEAMGSSPTRFVFAAQTATALPDLYLANGPELVTSSDFKRLTDLNGKLWATIDLPAPEEFRYKSFDGREIPAFIQKPPGFDPSKKYPLILNVHGGPHAAYGATFSHEFQWMAAKGYVVLYPNPRGSSSYGAEFGNIIQYRYPGDDYLDLMAGVDELIRRGYIDPKKLGITGGSGGGLLTNWAITRTDRFRRRRGAAVDRRLVGLVVLCRLLTLPPDLVQDRPVPRPRRLRRPVANHPGREGRHPPDADRRRGRPPDPLPLRRRDHVPRPEVPQEADHHGPLPRRVARTLPLRQALAPRRAPPAHRRLVRQVPPEQTRPPVRPARRELSPPPAT